MLKGMNRSGSPSKRPVLRQENSRQAYLDHGSWNRRDLPNRLFGHDDRGVQGCHGQRGAIRGEHFEP